MPTARSALIVLATMCSCESWVSFATHVQEFDAVTQRGGRNDEPERVEYDENPAHLPGVVRKLEAIELGHLLRALFEIEPTRAPEENPSGAAREHLEYMVDKAGRDLYCVGVVANRALWLAASDEYPLNVAQAVQAVGVMMQTLAIDPARVPLPGPDSPEQQRAVADAIRDLEAGWPASRTAESFTPAVRARYAQALQQLSAHPLPQRKHQRGVIRALTEAWRSEPNGELQAAAEAALRRALAYGLTAGLCDAMRLELPRADQRGRRPLRDFPLARIAAIRWFHVLSGPAATPQLLARISRPASRTLNSAQRYDPNGLVRLALIRVCAQVSPAIATRSFEGGPAPVEFLYEVCSGDPDEGLRVIALEGLALALGRPVDFDPNWADLFWRDFVATRGRA